MHSELVEQMAARLKEAGLLPLQKQAELSTRILQERLAVVLPWAMEAADVDFWLVVARENNLDPVLKTLYPWDMPEARRLGVLAFHRDKGTGKIRKMLLGPSSLAMQGIYEQVQRPGEDFWRAVVRVVKECNPDKIALNRSHIDGFSDGLSSTLYERLQEALGEEANKLCSGESLTVRWLQRVSPIEQQTMRLLVQLTQQIIHYAFSTHVIQVGKTTTTDVEWFMRDTINRLGFRFWFGPDVDLQRKGSSSSKLVHEVIQAGDLLHCDIGLNATYIQLHTDMQWVAYIRKPGERQAPPELAQLLAKANRLQDIVREKMAVSATGNDAFLTALAKARQEGLRPMIYTHPLGTFGHGAGPMIGKYTQQEFIPITGERPMEDQTFYALELNVCDSIKAWDDQLVYMFLEEVVYKEQKVDFVAGRQEELILI